MTWIAYFVLSKCWFLLYYSDKTGDLDVLTILKIFLQGLKLDASFAAYLSFLPFFIIAFSIWIPQYIYLRFIKVYTVVLIFAVNVLMFFDLALYGPWGMRLDSTPLMFLNTPKEMFASVPFWSLIGAIGLWIISSTIYAYLFLKVITKFGRNIKDGNLLSIPILLLLTGSLVIVLRGGLQTIPINQSNVYFSKNMFANHAAINFAWNFFQSVSHKGYETTNVYATIDVDKANSLLEMRTKRDLDVNAVFIPDSILSNPSPNIILIIWESFTAKSVEPLGGIEGVTDNFNALCKEGLLFTNFYANGNRSDKGLVSLLSGYYPQPNNSIIKMPNKSGSLPMLTKHIKKLGYSTAFYYGGDMNFGNMNTYMMQGEVDKIVDGDYFQTKDWNSKWGAHDKVLFDKFKNDLTGNIKAPFFKTIFTLSSHEPFEFPDTYKFGKKSNETKFLSSLAYTDKSLGDFIDHAKKQPWWNDTLVIITGDHGHPIPAHDGAFNGPKRFHIPMLWLGGALKKKNLIEPRFSGQTDLAATLLELLKADSSEFKWGTNIFKKSELSSVHYIFRDGFGTIDKNGHVVFDYVSKQPIQTEGSSVNYLRDLGQVLTQNAYQDFIER